jgi:hypothetical protein
MSGAIPLLPLYIFKVGTWTMCIIMRYALKTQGKAEELPWYCYKKPLHVSFKQTPTSSFPSWHIYTRTQKWRMLLSVWCFPIYTTHRRETWATTKLSFQRTAHFNKVVPTHAIQFYRGPKVRLHSFLILTPDLMARFMPRPLLPLVKEPQKQFDRKLSGPQSLSRRLRRKEESSDLVGNRTNSYSSNNTYWATPARYWYQGTR